MVKKIKIILLITIAQVLSFKNSFSQVGLPPSPTSVSLGEYAASPVGLYTSIPQINIPIYTLKSRQLSVPISLSYHGRVSKAWNDQGELLNEYEYNYQH